MNKDARLVEDMMEAIHRIQEYTTSIADEAEFLEDQKTQDVVIRNLEIIGEAAKGLGTSLRDAHPQIDWRRVAGMRDKLIHDYAGVDLGWCGRS